MLKAWFCRSMGFIPILLLPFTADAAWQRKFLPGAEAAEALCFDGSEPVMYTQKAVTETSNWIVYFEAGGFCATVEDCSRKFEENRFLFSSNFEAELGTFQGLNTFADSILNPFRKYNKLYVAYCSQDVWVGNQEVVRDGTVQARFQGYNIVRQVMRWLNNTELQPSSTLVMQGSSAGGFAVFNHLHWISQNVKHRELKGIIDSSWMTNIDNALGIFEVNQLSNVSTCLETWGGDAPCCAQLSCMALRHDFPPVNVPIFIIGHTYDFYLAVKISDSEAFRKPLDLMRYGERYNQEVITVSNAWKAAGKQVVLFISDCIVHSGFVTSSRSVLTNRECDDNIRFSFGNREGYYECNRDAWPNDAQGIAYYDDIFKVHMFSWSDTWERLRVGDVSMQRALMDWSQSLTPGTRLYKGVDHESFGELSFQSQWCPTKLDQLVSFDASLWDSMQVIGWILVCMIWLASFVSCLMVYFVEAKLMKVFEDELCLSEGQDTKKEIANPINEYEHTATTRTKRGIVLAFDELSLSVKDNQILQDVSGQMESGSVYAVMGGSGSGKTTLLNVLALRCKFGDLTGIVRCNGKDMDDFDSCYSYAKAIGFVTQYGLPPNSHLTVVECLYFSAIENMPKRTVHQRASRAGALLQAFNLKERAHVPVESLSGGQQRRLLVCIELLKNPPILFLDEPTSGLDATGALELVRICHQVAHSMDKLIIMTIHQPSFEAFLLLDKLVLLHKGKLVFLGDREEAIEEILPEIPGESAPMKASLNIADNLLSALPGFAEENKHDQAFTYVDPDQFRFLAKFTLPKFSVRLRVFTSSRWYSYRMLEVILLIVVIPLIVVVFLGLVNLGETPLQELIGTLMFLLSLPMTQLLPLLNATVEKRLWPVLQRCKNVEVKGTAWVFSWILTDFTVMMMSMVLAALIGSGIGLGEHYRAEDYRVVALVAACYIGSMSTIYICLCILFAPMVKDQADLKKIVAILVGLIIFAGSAYGGLMWRTENLPAPYQWLAFACPGTWSQLTVLISLFADRDLGQSSMCAQMSTFSVPAGFCSGNIVLEYFGVRKYTHIPEFFIVYSFGLMIFCMCIALFKLNLTFRGHLRVIRKRAKEGAVQTAKTLTAREQPQVLGATAESPEQAELSFNKTIGSTTM